MMSVPCLGGYHQGTGQTRREDVPLLVNTLTVGPARPQAGVATALRARGRSVAFHVWAGRQPPLRWDGADVGGRRSASRVAEPPGGAEVAAATPHRWLDEAGRP